MYAIAEAESNIIYGRVQGIGQKIRSENGVEDAIKLIEMYAAEFRSTVNYGIQK